MEGGTTGQVRHGNAATTHAVRAAIQRSQASLATLSRKLGIDPKTVAKWRKRQTLEDMKTGPKEPWHGLSRLPDVEGDKPKRQRFKRYPIGFFHIDIAEVQTGEGKLCLFVSVDRLPVDRREDRLLGAHVAGLAVLLFTTRSNHAKMLGQSLKAVVHSAAFVRDAAE